MGLQAVFRDRGGILRNLDRLRLLSTTENAGIMERGPGTAGVPYDEASSPSVCPPVGDSR